MPELLLKAEAVLGAFLIRLWRATLKIEVENQPPDGFPCVYALWHRNLLLLAMQRIGSGAVVMVSSSQDGELIAGPLRHLGYTLVRGSSTRQGSQALKKMLGLARGHSLAITPDGPKGPVGTIHPGLFQLAWLAGIPIIPVAVDCRREWIVRSWDRFRVPKPFSRLRAVYGDQLWLRSKSDFSTCEAQLREAFAALESSLG